MKNKIKENKKTIIGIIIGILIMLLLVFGYLYWQSRQLTEYEKSIDAITEIDPAERQREVDQLVKDGEINIQYNAGATFKGKVSTSFNVKNIENNKGNIKFTLYDENGNTIYESKEIKRGYEVNKIELDKALTKGTHECRISIGYVNRGNVASTFPITIEVK